MYVFIMHNLPHHHHHHPLPITLQLAICISALLLMITNTNELMMTHAASTQAEAPLIHAHNSSIVDVNANSSAISTHHSAQALTPRHLESDGDGNNHHHNNNWADITTIIDIQVSDKNAMNVQIISTGIDEKAEELLIDGGKYSKISGSKSKKRGGRHGHGRVQRRRRLRRSGGGGGFGHHVLFRLTRTTTTQKKKKALGGGSSGGGHGGLFHTDYSSPHTHPPHHN